MRHYNYTLVITKLECLRSSPERSRDDVYLRIYPDGDSSREQVHFFARPIKMNEDGTGDCARHVDVAIDATYLDRIVVQLWDKDDDVNRDDKLGEITITLDDELESFKTACQQPGTSGARYAVYWRGSPTRRFPRPGSLQPGA
jgi:hypothetical protein